MEIYVSGDSDEQVRAFYRRVMAEQGWEVWQEDEAGPGLAKSGAGTSLLWRRGGALAGLAVHGSGLGVRGSGLSDEQAQSPQPSAHSFGGFETGSMILVHYYESPFLAKLWNDER